MRRLILLATAALALSAAGYALADDIGAGSVTATTASFAATAAGNVQTRTCSNADGTFAATRGSYTGTATSSDSSLNGPVRLDVQALINTTKNVGTVSGRLTIDLPGRKNTQATFQAVYSGGTLAGLAVGHTQDEHTRLLANLSAGFSATGGFTSGQLGGSAGGAAVEVAPGRCRPTPNAPKERIEARGAVTQISTTSVSVAGVTCTIPPALQPGVAKKHVAVGDRVDITCTVTGTVNTLTRLDVLKRH